MDAANHPIAQRVKALSANPRDGIVAVWRDVAYTQSELELAFEVVAHVSDWKADIDAIIPDKPRLRNAIEAAVMFFTATPVTFHKITRAGYVHATAKGYRMGPAGP